MKKNLIHICWFIPLTFVTTSLFSQPYSIKFEIKGQPNRKVILGTIKGDDFFAKDSTVSYSEIIHFSLPTNSESGIYRVILGQTPYARIMNEAPQHLDFIFNKEDIEICTEFKTPKDSAVVIQSVENDLWFSFHKFETNYQKEIALLEQEVDYFWSKQDTQNVLKKANEFNEKQSIRNLSIKQNCEKYSDLLAAKLIALFYEPVRDGHLSPDDRKKAYQKDYFTTIDFSDAELIKSAGYTDKVFQYLTTYNSPELTQKERETAYKKGVDIILSNTTKNIEVSEFITNYLCHGFEVLKMQNVIDHIKNSQVFSIKFEVKDQPNSMVTLGFVKGNDFIAIDSTRSNNEITCVSLPWQSESGIYRAILSDKHNKKSVNTVPRHIDFIFNKEHIEIKTTFTAPQDSAVVIHSRENELWFSFLNYETNYRKNITALEQEADNLWAKQDTANALKKTNEFNQTQITRNLMIEQNTQKHPELFATKIISLFIEPVKDGFLSPDERNKAFRKEYNKTAGIIKKPD
ncbi:hypothetical protein OU798_01095 [Prolixibacteraceae bacterium Z1-6]|uniref:DUF4369 domain-containing protein n=1 Tax=Draconibacterium aestuarii TaxID=2998507 RepID=A0A9X3F4Q6_9BACT|nr:hypothetical protein [Prolixibacteraceae bacterium Z1-6]